MRGAVASSIALLAVVTLVDAAAARQACRSIDFGGRDVSYCQEVCRTTPAETWLAGWQPRPQHPPVDAGGDRPRSPPTQPSAVPQPWKIASCKVKAIPGGCEITVCGLVQTPQDTLRKTTTKTNVDSRLLVPKPQVGPPSPNKSLDPSLLEGDGGGLGRSGPAAGGGLSAPAGAGGGIGGATYSRGVR